MNNFEQLRATLRARLVCLDASVGLDKILEIAKGCVERLDAHDFPLPTAQPYSRTILYASSEIEMMIARWGKDAHCAPHDHGKANSLIYILSGQAQHRLYQIKDGLLQMVHQEQKLTGECIRCAPFQVHSMGPQNTLLTLHIYAPSIEDMYVYHIQDRLTFRVRGSCGAWLPVENPNDIFETFLDHQQRLEEGE